MNSRRGVLNALSYLAVLVIIPLIANHFLLTEYGIRLGFVNFNESEFILAGSGVTTCSVINGLVDKSSRSKFAVITLNYTVLLLWVWLIFTRGFAEYDINSVSLSINYKNLSYLFYVIVAARMGISYLRNWKGRS